MSVRRALFAGAAAWLLVGCAGALPVPEHFSAQPVTVGTEASARSTAELVGAISAGRASAEEVAVLRSRGPSALDALLAAYDAAPDSAKAGIRAAIDEVAQQRDADVSRLYWYTDFAEAQRVARDSGKPILSLRLLGELDDDLSCANSRFFRTALYANARVSKALRERFVLHWSTEREAPIVTIDFRDGRKVVRTITGNSLHYVLDSSGRPLDALPGLYGPDAFLTALASAEKVAAEVRAADGVDAARIVTAYHRAELDRYAREWASRSSLAGFPGAAAPVSFATDMPIAPPKAGKPGPPAAVAMPLAVGKSMVEAPILKATDLPGTEPAASVATVPSALWGALASSALPTTRLDDASRALIRRKQPMSWYDPSGPRPMEEAELGVLFARFEQRMAEDTVKNELELHPRLHAWLAAEGARDLRALNERVYRELFLTPAADPWLGLVPPDVFTGLQGDGLVPR
jgi:hypothetical protein